MKNLKTKLLSGLMALVMSGGLSYALFTSSIDRLIASGASAPALTSCGTGALGAGSSDTAGDVTATGSATCTLTFGVPFATAPSCTFTDLTAPSRAFTVVVAAATITLASMTSGDKVSYICIGKAGG